MTQPRESFSVFYAHVFLPEHKNPLNVGLHVLGTVLGLALVVTAGIMGALWWALLFPVVHAVPGLVGHRLVERSDAVGDLRVTRKDFSPLWFIAANHRMTWELVTRGCYWRSRV